MRPSCGIRRSAILQVLNIFTLFTQPVQLAVIITLNDPAQTGCMVSIEFLDEVQDLSLRGQHDIHLPVLRVEPNRIHRSLVEWIRHRYAQVAVFNPDRRKFPLPHEFHGERILHYRNGWKIFGGNVGDLQVFAQLFDQVRFRDGPEIDQQLSQPLARLFLQAQGTGQLLLGDDTILHQLLT